LISYWQMKFHPQLIRNLTMHLWQMIPRVVVE